jgi:hypothetical protein
MYLMILWSRVGYTSILAALLFSSLQVRESFNRPGDVGPHATATVACFLIQEGASIVTQNKKGHTPLQACTPEIVSLVMAFKDSLAMKR